MGAERWVVGSLTGADAQNGAADGNRTRVFAVAPRGSAIELRLLGLGSRQWALSPYRRLPNAHCFELAEG